MTDLILEARKTWWEIVNSDEGDECREMGIIRELADEVEAHRRLLVRIDKFIDAVAPTKLTKELASIRSEIQAALRR